jgi:hypothetical protein
MLIAAIPLHVNSFLLFDFSKTTSAMAMPGDQRTRFVGKDIKACDLFFLSKRRSITEVALSAITAAARFIYEHGRPPPGELDSRAPGLEEGSLRLKPLLTVIEKVARKANLVRQGVTSE